MAKKPLANVWTVDTPIDWWSGMIDLTKHSPREFATDYGNGEALKFEAEVHALLAAAQRVAAEQSGWEGDMSQGPFLSAIPNRDGGTNIILAWKQSNNGSTFIASDAMLVGFGGIPRQGR